MAALVLLTLSGCAFDAGRARTLEIAATAAGAMDFNGVPIENGQIIVSARGTESDFMVSLFAAEYSAFTHSGIVAVEDNQIVVYEALATLRPYLRGPPTRVMRGSVRRTPVGKFLKRNEIVALYSPPVAVDRDALVQFARNHHRSGTGFDPYFDGDDASGFYCNELVARALEHAGRAAVAATRRNPNRSLQRILEWLEITAPEFVQVADILDGAQPAVLISRRHTRAELDAFFGMRRELHRRFTIDQRPGNLFRWSLTGPRFRESVEAFLEAGMKDAERTADAADDRRYRALAEIYLGRVAIHEVVAAGNAD